jgi:uncharacterized membrane protein YbhN (UPF0104 family)
MRKLFAFLVKAAVSGVLLYLTFRSVNLTVVSERLSGLNAGWMLLVLILMLLQIMLLALRWRQIVIAAGAGLPFTAALRYSLIATFFNQTLPSTVGGDAARLWLLARRGAGWKLATYSVLIDRGVGVFVLAVIVAGCLPWTLALIREPVGRAMLVLIGIGSILGAAAFLAIPLAPKRWTSRWWATRHLVAVADIAWRLCRSARTMIFVAVLSIAIHVMTVVAAWATAKAVAMPLEFAFALFLIPPVLLIATIPISIAGWGVREGAMIAAFGYAGLAAGDGLVLSVLFGAAAFVVGALGGLLWIVTGERIAPPALEEGLHVYERR